MIYIMRRTQLYLDDDLWASLHARARQEKTTISELVRTAARDRYLGNLDKRARAMQAAIGIRKEPGGAPSAVRMVRAMRRGNRIGRLGGK